VLATRYLEAGFAADSTPFTDSEIGLRVVCTITVDMIYNFPFFQRKLQIALKGESVEWRWRNTIAHKNPVCGNQEDLLGTLNLKGTAGH
jgi:hypothetical protein